MRCGRRHSRGPAAGPQFPGAASTGAPPLTGLTAVPATQASGSGWAWNGGTGAVNITGAIVFAGFDVAGDLNINASGVTISGSTINGEITVAGSGGPVTGTLISKCVIIAGGEGIKLGDGGANIPANTTIADCTISGSNATWGRLAYGVDDNYFNAVNTVILRCNIYWCRVAATLNSGLIQDCYFHDWGYINGDHSDGVAVAGVPSGSSLQILHSAILMQSNETSPVPMGSDAYPCQDITVDSCLLAGGDYGIYAGFQGNAHHIDGGCATHGTASVDDAAAAAGDLGAVITGSGIPANTSIIAVFPGSGYTLSQAATTSLGSVTLTVTFLNLWLRTDPGCAISSTSSLVVSDPSAVSSDVGATVTCTTAGKIPAFTTITAAGSGSYTLSALPLATGSGLTFQVHFTNNLTITRNRFSEMFFPGCGSTGDPAADWDPAPPSNVWAGNVFHESAAPVSHP